MNEVAPVALGRPSRVRYQVLAAACVLAIIAYVHRVGFARALPRVSEDLGLGDHHAGWLTAAFLIAYGGFEMPWGLAGDRWGARHLLPILVLGWSLATGCVALTTSFTLLLVLRFVFGTFQAGAFPVLARVMTDWMPTTERAKAQGLIWMATRLGGMVIPLGLGALIAWYGDWRVPMWLIASLGVGWAVVFWPWFRNEPRAMPAVNESETALIEHGRTHAAGHGSVPWTRFLTCPSVWSLCLLYGFGGFASNFYVTLLPTYLARHRQLGDADTSLLSSLPFLCGAVTCLLGGLLSDGLIRWTGNRTWGRRLNGTVGMLVGGFAWLGLNWVESVPALAVVLCLIFACNDLAMGPAWASCADVGERYAGTLGGAMNMTGNLLGAVGGIVAGYLLESRHADWLFVVYAVSFWLGSLCWLSLDVTRTLAVPTAVRPNPRDI